MGKLLEFYRRELRGKLRVWLSWIVLPVVLGTVWRWPTWPGVAVLAFGAFLRVWASGYLDKEGKLSFNGPYHFSRNPLYLGSILIGVAIPISQELWNLAVGIFVVTWIVHIAIIQAEEKVLKEKFAPEYLNYMKRTPRFFSFVRFLQAVFYVFVPRREGVTFSWRLWKRNKGWEAIPVAVALYAVACGIAYYRQPHPGPAVQGNTVPADSIVAPVPTPQP
jgi:protein-S-isoprenylcysteine O-methyltransferase Ste14